MEIPHYRKKSFTNEWIIQDNPLLRIEGTPYHIIELNPLLYKETPYYGKNTFP